MPTIQRDQSTSLLGSEAQNLFVRNRLPSQSTFLDRHHIMSKPPQFFCCRERKVFVCVEVCHAVITHYAASLALICSSISAVWERQ